MVSMSVQHALELFSVTFFFSSIFFVGPILVLLLPYILVSEIFSSCDVRSKRVTKKVLTWIVIIVDDVLFAVCR